MSAPYEVRAVEHLGGHRLRLTFADGLVGDVDLAERFAGPVGPMFEPLCDADYFARVSVDEELGDHRLAERGGPRSGRSSRAGDEPDLIPASSNPPERDDQNATAARFDIAHRTGTTSGTPAASVDHWSWSRYRVD